MDVSYSFLQECRREEVACGGLRDAVNRACTHLRDSTAMPIEISRDGVAVYSLTDLADLFFYWEAWTEGAGDHPVSEEV